MSSRTSSTTPSPSDPLRSAPSPDCGLCPRLAAFRAEQRQRFPAWHNAPVASFGPGDAPLLIVGLAPGLRGANRTGRPFTGDYAGLVLYPALLAAGLARGRFEERPDDGLELVGCRITNAVRCVPPANKPETGEIAHCRSFLEDELLIEPAPRVVLALGRIAHASVLRVFKASATRHPFAHGAVHEPAPGRILVASYHCSRYNINTNRVTPAMIGQAIELALSHLRS